MPQTERDSVPTCGYMSWNGATVRRARCGGQRCRNSVAVVWDTLTLPGEAAPLAQVQSGGMPYYVVYSHGDWDHAWGTAGLGTMAAWVSSAHVECLRRFGDDAPRTLQQNADGRIGQVGQCTSHPAEHNIQHPAYLSIWADRYAGVVSHYPGHTVD